MKDIHCEKCGRFLLKLMYGVLDVKCSYSRCKHINHVKLIDQAELAKLTLAQEESIIKA